MDSTPGGLYFWPDFWSWCTSGFLATKLHFILHQELLQEVKPGQDENSKENTSGYCNKVLFGVGTSSIEELLHQVGRQVWQLKAIHPVYQLVYTIYGSIRVFESNQPFCAKRRSKAP